MVGIAESTLAKIETKRLPLSNDNALRISEVTGAAMDWLLDGNLGNPAAGISNEGKRVEFTRQFFLDHVANRDAATLREGLASFDMATRLAAATAIASYVEGLPLSR
jgi:hypothetical protein